MNGASAYPPMPHGTYEARPPQPAIPAPILQTPGAARTKHVARSLTCHSLRQPATGYGLDNALHFTADVVKQRLPPKRGRGKKASVGGVGPEASTKIETESVVGVGEEIERPGTVRPVGRPQDDEVEIPIDPALTDAQVSGSQGSKRGQPRVEVVVADSEDEEYASGDGTYKPGKSIESSARKGARRMPRRSVVVSREELQNEDDEIVGGDGA